MQEDLIIYDLHTSNRLAFSMDASPKQQTFYIHFSTYFPFDEHSLEYIESIDEESFILGVGYPSKSNPDGLRDIQIGITGGVKQCENIRSAARRELTEETGIDIETCDTISCGESYMIGRKEWYSSTIKINPDTMLSDNVSKCMLRDSYAKKSIGMIVSGRAEEFEMIYKNLKTQNIYKELMHNPDKIRYIMFIRKSLVLKKTPKCKVIDLGRVPLVLTFLSINKQNASSYKGPVLGYNWENDHIIPKSKYIDENRKIRTRRKKAPIMFVPSKQLWLNNEWMT